jgi:hypothetical protein
MEYWLAAQVDDPERLKVSHRNQVRIEFGEVAW